MMEKGLTQEKAGEGLDISIDETNNTVWITGIIYEKQDQFAALRRMPMI